MNIVAQNKQQHNRLITNHSLMSDSSAATSCPDPRSSLLGTIAEFSSASDFSPQNDPKDLAIKHRYELVKTAARLLPDERIAKCMSSIAPLATHVSAWHDPDQETAGYRDLQRCESDSCPFCAYARSECQRHKLVVALATAKTLGYFPYLVTLTLRHNRGHELGDLRTALLSAYNRLFSARAYGRLKDEYLIVGKVRSEEVTYGANGWHPHLHVLIFSEMELVGPALARFEALLTKRWLHVLDQEGHSAAWEYGLQVESADSAIADYVAKWGHDPIDFTWGVDAELARSTVKRAHRDGMTPFQLLGVAAGAKVVVWRSKDGEQVVTNFDLIQNITGLRNRTKLRGRGATLYMEYFRAYKGKSRFHWGKDLINALDLDNALDSYLEQNPMDPDARYEMLLIDRDNWIKVLQAELRAQLLIEVRSGDIARVGRWLADYGLKAIFTRQAVERAQTLQAPPGAENVLPVESAPKMPKIAPGGENAAIGQESQQPTLFEPQPGNPPNLAESAYSRSFAQTYGDVNHARTRKIPIQTG